MYKATLDETKILMKAVGPTLERRTGAVLFRIPGSQKAGEFDFGSSVVIRFSRCLIVVTAAHVMQEVERAEYGLIPLGATSWDRIVWLSPRMAYSFGGADGDAVDLACFEISEDELKAWGIEATNITNVAVIDLGEMFAILHGYPGEQAEFEVEGSKIHTKYMMFATSGVPRDRWPPTIASGVKEVRLDPLFNHVLHYPTTNTLRINVGGDTAARLPVPKGISGSGIWTTIMKPNFFSPLNDLALVGIEYAWLAKSGFVIGNTMRPVIQLIERAFPELRPELSAVTVYIHGDKTEPASM